MSSALGRRKCFGAKLRPFSRRPRPFPNSDDREREMMQIMASAAAVYPFKCRPETGVTF